MGTAYFADKVREFGGVHLVLASYNAGEARSHNGSRSGPGIEREEFIDDIPFPETQNYVKRILGTAEDYRRLYGGERRVSASTARADAIRAARRRPRSRRAPEEAPPRRRRPSRVRIRSRRSSRS